MGYADTLPYQQIKLSTSNIPTVDLTTVATDFDLNTFKIPDFKRPISYATFELHYTGLYNSSAGANWVLGAGSFGIKDYGGTFRASEAWISENIYSHTGGAYYHGDAALMGGNNLASYIKPNTTNLRAALNQTRTNSDGLTLRNVYGVLNLYFNI